ncbi:patatin family protein [Dictyostelium discoideum AX4]|uniref:Patatin family protein n=1 Tax=Dictyostelium discoideum TaxID=44689 RepID=Q54XY1_DICDI|nr:patatin family protein [Dictyostelium discoideum AX4]EAL68435.1 patatin family protein [Dictyostelium discoideum AX4]|eukprot:XP_642421.1 patatin family protein [Dictyostelium discoideum AX4]
MGDNKKENIRIILSLDGGGTKGLYTIEVIEHFVKLSGSDFTKHVDLFGGTSTGGILSIAKSKEISNSELLNMYEGKESKKIFGSLWDEVKGVFTRGEMFNSDELINIANSWFPSSPDGADTQITELNEKKFFVVSLKKTGEKNDILTPVIISNYKFDETTTIAGNNNNNNNHFIKGEEIERLYTIGEEALSLADAIRATSSIPAAFQKHKQGDEEYLDGGFKYNNPMEIAYHEARIIYPNDYLVIISIGCTDKDVQGLTENNKEINDRLEKLLDNMEDGVETKGIFSVPHYLKSNWITDFLDTIKLNKNSKSSQQLYIEAMQNIKDSNAFLLRFDSVETHSLLSFSDTSKEFFEKLRKCSSALSKDSEFIRTADLLKRIIDLKKDE